MDGPTMTLAVQMALREIKSKIQAEGLKLHDYAASDLRNAAARYLNNHPEIIKTAARRIATDPRFAKFKTSAQKRSR